MGGYATQYEDIYLAGGCRTGFGDLGGSLANLSPTDMGIAVARDSLTRAGAAPQDIDLVIASNIAQSSFDALYFPRHIGLYADIPVEVPALLTQRLCGSGFELLTQAADAITLGRGTHVLCVGAESMSRNPICSYTARGGIALGQAPDFRDFLWESLRDTATDVTMGGTAENLARDYQIGRETTDRFAARSFQLACEAQESGFLAGEITPLENQTFEANGYRPRELRLGRRLTRFDSDEHVRPTDEAALAELKPVFGGVQTAGNSSAIVDGAAAMLVVKQTEIDRLESEPQVRLLASATIGVPPHIMGIGPAAAIKKLLAATELTLDDIDLIEINEAFGAQVLACLAELGIDEARVNVNGGAIALGHPLAATGLRCTLTLARQLAATGGKLGIASACIGGGQGIAVLVEAVG